MGASGRSPKGGTVEMGVHDRLVEAAEHPFCARGFNETSVRNLAAGAGQSQIEELLRSYASAFLKPLVDWTSAARWNMS